MNDLFSSHHFKAGEMSLDRRQVVIRWSSSARRRRSDGKTNEVSWKEYDI